MRVLRNDEGSLLVMTVIVIGANMVRMPHWPKILGKHSIRMGCEKARTLLKAIGDPHLKLPEVIHVAGTNGKGSTIAFMRSILQQAGYKVDCYTSPHLLEFNERIMIDGLNISDDLLGQVTEEVRLAAEYFPPDHFTFFEATTAIAFLAFSRSGSDILLLETGLGGRLDATNVVPHPAVTVITPISIDHTEYLGSTLELIAGEKAGIIKENVPVVISAQYDDVYDVLHSVAEIKHAESFSYEFDWIVEISEYGWGAFVARDRRIDIPVPSLIGDHQYINAGTAIAAIQKLTTVCPQFQISDKAIYGGVSSAVWMARMQQLNSGRLVDLLGKNWELWVDGAHNQSGAHTIASWLRQFDNVYFLIGMTNGRDVAAFINNFKSFAKIICGVFIANEPSAYQAKHIYNVAVAEGFVAYEAESIEDAILYISKNFPPGKIIACGSLYLAGELICKNSRN